MTPRQIAISNGIPHSTFYARIDRGWPEQRAATEPVNDECKVRRIARAIAKGNGINSAAFRGRLMRGYSLVEAATKPKQQHFYDWNQT